MIGDLVNAGVSLFNGLFNRNAQQENNQQQAALQREFAQSGIQWKVQDALKAGIHPLAALGTQTASYSPQSIGDTSFGDMGQSLGRAAKAAMSQEDRSAKEATDLALEKARLENDLIRQQLTSSRIATTSRRSGGTVGPAMPTGASIPMPSPGPTRTSYGFPVEEDKIKSKEDTYPANKQYRFGGIPLMANPWFSDAQDQEDRLGETLSDWVGGPINLLGDGAYTVWKRAIQGRDRAAVRSNPFSRRYERR